MNDERSYSFQTSFVSTILSDPHEAPLLSEIAEIVEAVRRVAQAAVPILPSPPDGTDMALRVCEALNKLGALNAPLTRITALHQLREWLSGHNVGDNLDICVLNLDDGRYTIVYCPDDDTFQISSPSIKRKRQLLSNNTHPEVIRGLEAWLTAVELEAQAQPDVYPPPYWMRQVYDALCPFASPSTTLPKGLTSDMVIFLARTAAIYAWETLADKDGRIPPLLLGYYTSDTSFKTLGHDNGGISAGRVSQLVSSGIHFLWDELERSKLGRDLSFTEEEMHRGRQGRGGKASHETAKARWDNADKETRLDWLEKLDAAAHTESAEKKRQARALDRMAKRSAEKKLKRA